ncbi:MAG: Cna B-type domain-containing protein, partial [Clostridiales bacterium]|nr:Cna B-type domain-containing protein [Clostridiales bacterium]
MKKFFQNKKFISVTAGVLATSLVVGNLAISRSKMKKGQISSSATVYADDHLLDFDASSQVNFSTILGRAIDYGIVSDVVDQKGHMETTYATNKFVNPGAANNCDVDLAGNATAQFIIASVENGSKARFGNTYNGQEMPFVIDTTYDMAANEDANFVYDTACKASVLYRTYDYDVLKSNVDSMISKGKKQSDILAAKPAFDGNTIATKRGDSGATVDLSDPSYQNATVYINVEGGSQLETAIQNADGLLIKKHPSTNVVFNMLGTGEIKLTQYRVQIVGETFTLDPDNGQERSDYSFDSTTTCGGYDSLHNAHVEEYMTKSIIFNIRNASSVKYNMTAGLFLVPNNIPGEVVGSSAGWIVSSGRTTVSSGEFHYIYHDREFVANTEGTSVIHFAARKAFTEDYDNINELTNVALTKGEYKFSFIETESDYRTEKEGGVKDLNCAVDAYSKITFPNITVAVETVDPYIPQKRYFVVRENPTTSDDPNVGLSNPTDPKVELSEGEIDIELTITNVDGIIHYYVNTFKYYEAKNGQQPDDGDNNVAASGAEFSLGGFYNKYDVENGKLTLKKAFDGDSPANDYPDKTYKMAVRKGLLYVQQDGSLSVDEYYFQVPADSNGIEISGLTPGDYTIVEDEGNLRGYNFVSSSMSSTVTVNNTTSGPNDITADGKVSLTGSSEAEVVVTNTYEKIDVSGKASLTINKQIEVNGEAVTPDTISEELASQEYSFYVSTISEYNRLFLTDYNGSLGQDYQKYTFKTTFGEPIVIYGLEPNKEYIVQEVAPNGQLRSYNLNAISIDGTDYSNNIYNAAKGITTGAADSNTNVDVVNGYQEIKKNLTIRKAFVNAQNSGMSIAPEDLDKLEGIRLTVKGPNGFKQEITGTQLRKNNWQYTLNDVPVGDYVVEETGADKTSKGQYVFSYCDVTGNSPTRDNDGTLTVTNRYSVVSLGVLTVRKGVNANGAATPAFFEVYIQNEDGKYYTDEGPERFVPHKRAVRVPANGSFQTVAIPEGKYTVTENAESARVAGYELVTSYKTGNEEGINYINLKNYGGTVEVTNTYTKYKIEVTKLEAGDHMYDNWTYQFWVRDLNRTDGVYYIKADGESASLADGQDPYYFSVKAGDSNSETVLLKNAGQYQVIEKNANEAANNAFDLTTTYSVADGIVTVSDSDASSAAAVTITNTYKYTNVGSLTVGKTLTGTGKDTQKAFDIVITFSTPINYSVNGGEKIATASDTYTAHLKDTETVTLGDIPAGVTYTVSETISQADQIAGYELSSITGDTDKAIKKNVTNVVTVNNTFAFESVESTVKKVWDDSNNQDGIRPASVTVQMKRNGVDFGEPVVLSADNNWTYTATELAKYDASKNAYTYTWAETAVADYEASYETEGTVTTVTNTHTVATTSLSVEKKWNHKMNPASNQPASVEVKLYAGDSLVATKTLSADNQWKETVSNLPVKAGGTDIEYRWEETVPDNYNAAYTVEDGKTTITNTYDSSVDTTSATVKKVWEDSNNQDGIRPPNVTVQLKRNGEAIGDAVVLNAANNWTYTATGLQKYDSTDNEYTYTWAESAVSGYEAAYETEDNVTTVTNTHTTATTSLSVEKNWNHKMNEASNQPASVEVKLYADGEPIVTKILSADNQWKATETDLPVNKNGTAIEYEWKETDVDNYDAVYSVADGKTTITNTYDSSSETTSATVTKEWDDDNNRDGIRPASVTVQLNRNGEAFGDPVVLNAGNSWTFKAENLAKYDAADAPYIYTWTETAVDGYTASYETEG